MPIPSDADQVLFLSQIQRLLTEGQFTSTYKFALLHALADLAVEKGSDDGEPLPITSVDLAEKFISYYWRQAVPYAAPGVAARVLNQNTDKQAAVLKAIEAARAKQPSLSRLRSTPNWKPLVTKVASTISTMPLWKLQRLGPKETLAFLYENVGRGSKIELRSTAVFCLRRFYGLVVDLVQGAWLRFVRRLRENQATLGQAGDLAEFLFGSDRGDLSAFGEALRPIQDGRCFYCDSKLVDDRGAVDHFIPWSRYSVDLGHNFVLAHGSCNTSKSDRIAATEHLERWWQRNDARRDDLAAEFDRLALPHALEVSRQVALWTYGQVEQVGGMVWVKKEEMVTLGAGWRGLLGVA